MTEMCGQPCGFGYVAMGPGGVPSHGVERCILVAGHEGLCEPSMYAARKAGRPIVETKERKG